MTASALTQAPKGDTGDTGVAGAVWRTGSGVPSNGLGINGDYYVNTVNSDVYYKSGGTYSIVVNIRGANADPLFPLSNFR